MVLTRKSAKNNVAPEKQPRSQWQEHLPVIASVSGVLTLIFIGLFFLTVYRPEQILQTQQVQAIGQQGSSQLQVGLKNTQAQARQLAGHPIVIEALAADKKTRNEHLLNSSCNPLLAPGKQLQLFSADIDSENAEKIGFAVLDLGRRTLEGNATIPEAAKVNSQWRILSASPVLQGKKIIGVVLISPR